MKQDYDVLIIGSGASGGMAAYTLTKLGISCLMLDAGPLLDFEKQRELKPVYDLPYRGFGEPGRFPHVTQASEFDANLWADEKQNPYTYDPKDPYYWVRIRLIGGKTLRWGRASWRMSDYEFKNKDHDGFGDNWPISYADLAPYYDRVEPMFRVSGRKEGFPQLPDGVFIEDNSRDSASVQRFLDSAKRMGVPTTKQRRATGTLASSVNLLLPDALATGKLRIVPNAVVREITVDRNSAKVNGVSFVDRKSKREYHATARVVMVGASCLESTRLLLNSASRQYPNGLGNSSGALGHYLFDQFYVKGVVQAVVPEARGGKAARGLMGGGGYIPRFRNLANREKKFIRGYAYDFGSGGTPAAKYLPLYGEALLKELADVSGAGFDMTTMGTVLPRFEHHVRIDAGVKDAWGIPALHISQRYTDNEIEMAKDSMSVGEELCRGAGFEVIAKHHEMVPPGESIHELGTCRMGESPKTSVLNGFNQSHDIRNLFVIDGSSFVSGGAQNPTLTIAALAMRASEYLAEEMRKGSV
ncbi:MAG TPA: GMC family oxidoreductase [Bryobacteraceae bacterium]|nr:GMC family oxidoreductase [Bryobacteraceae bacterium]